MNQTRYIVNKFRKLKGCTNTLRVETKNEITFKNKNIQTMRFTSALNALKDRSSSNTHRTQTQYHNNDNAQLQTVQTNLVHSSTDGGFLGVRCTRELEKLQLAKG